jgi:hypothetical protein
MSDRDLVRGRTVPGRFGPVPAASHPVPCLVSAEPAGMEEGTL